MASLWTLDKIHERLCVRDRRSPYFNEPEDGEEEAEPRKDCYCDNCYYGRDAMAIQLLFHRVYISVLKATPE